MSGEAKVILAVIVLIVFISIALILLAVGRHWEDGHVRPRGGGGLHDPQCQCDYADEVQALADYVAKLEARTPSVIPLVWVRMLDPVGHPTDLHRAWCPLFEQYYWAERDYMMPKVEARRTARIMKVIQIKESATL